MAFMLPRQDEVRPEPSVTTTRPIEGPKPPPRAASSARGRRRRPLEPIGPEQLRRLRQSILNGTYPLDEAVIGGLARMFMGPMPGKKSTPCPDEDA